MIRLFAAVNGEVIDDLEDNTTPTYTRIHYLINGLKMFKDVEVTSISYHLLANSGVVGILYNNVLKTMVALRSALLLISSRPIVYFAYPSSLTTIQNRALFRICRMIGLEIILDIHDTVEQAGAVGGIRSTLNTDMECSYFKIASLILALNRQMWGYLAEKYQISGHKQVVFVPNAFEEDFCRLFPDSYKCVANRFNICYLGGLTKNRGIEILFNACQELHKKYPYMKLFLFGSFGESISLELKDAIERSDFILRKQIPRKDLPDDLHDVDLFVMPYDPRESYMNFSSPTKLFEYIGTAKPILCTKCESLLEIGKDGGIIFIDYDALDLGKKTEMLILNPETRETLSKELIKIRSHHTWKERAKVVHEALKSL
jgi:glycosyltransferase involved in cell wall biosynthesis